jgi:hypothetical protein
MITERIHLEPIVTSKLGILNFPLNGSIRTQTTYKNYDIVEEILYYYNLVNTPPDLIKIKGHSNSIRNDEVDLLAKKAAKTPLEEDVQIFRMENKQKHQYFYLKNQIINEYPNSYFKKMQKDNFNNCYHSYWS